MSLDKKIVEFWKHGKKIIGAGLNYKSIVNEQNVPIPSEPLIFTKPTSSYIIEGQTIEIPKGFLVNQEVELGVVISKKCKNIKSSEVSNYIGGYCLALDLTATNILEEARSKGLPWAIGKGFDTATPISSFIECKAIPNPADLHLWSKINGELRQSGNTSDMIFSIGDLISHVSKYMTLDPYDLVITGTPKGAGPIHAGEVIEAGFGDIIKVRFPVKSA
uniref:oxaloacetate tautomerase n=1 Tax=Clastoptera arizonana TaxID=38151 RepID=A0A1B6CC57_9HEMI